jgi:hypothetical protein
VSEAALGRFYEDGEIVARQGEVGDCLSIRVRELSQEVFALQAELREARRGREPVGSGA